MKNGKRIVLIETILACTFMSMVPFIIVLFSVFFPSYAPTMGRTFFEHLSVLIVFAIILKVLSKQYQKYLSKKAGIYLLLFIEIFALLAFYNAVGVINSMLVWYFIVPVYCASLFIDFFPRESRRLSP